MTGPIVAGVEGSQTGREALRFAVAEARLRGAPVRVVHAWSAPPVIAGDIAFTPVAEPPLGDLRAAAEEVLADELRRVGSEASGVLLEGQVVEGQPAAALLEAASGAELLVVGSRGHGALAGALLGSVSQQCLHHAACPIAIVHVAHYAQHGRIVVGVDASAGSDTALAWAVEEARLRGASLHAVAGYFEPWGIAAGGLSNPQAVVELRHSLVQQAEQTLEHARSRVPDDVEITAQAVHSPAANALLSAAGDADLLVVGSRGRGGFASLVLGSVSQHCAARAPGTVVVVPSRAAER